MPVFCQNNFFHIQTRNTSYIMDITSTGELRHLYYGNKLPSDAKLSHTNLQAALGESPVKGDRSQYYGVIGREYPFYGRSDYREGALHIQNMQTGDSVLQLEYQSCRISEGVLPLHGLPHARNSEAKGDTLSIFMEDKSLSLVVEIRYTIFEDSNMLVRSAVLTNKSKVPLKILSALSSCLDIRNDKNWELISLNGAWARERKVERAGIPYGIRNISSTQGNSSSSTHNPFAMLVRPYTTENSGEAIGFALIYSGNHKLQMELTPFNDLRIMQGLNPFDFCWYLESGEEFQTPQALMCYSSQGIGTVSREFHTFIQNHIVSPQWKNHPRYVLINNWEGTYFDFNEDEIISMAGQAKDLGIELFVLDDGWFGKRNDDTTSLGDWFENKKKLSKGISGLSKKITALGLKFGLWFEPEMISEDSVLFQNHPDWRIDCPRYPPCQGRNQYVLDMSCKDVQDYLFESMAKILSSSDISYIKWDKNRNLTDIVGKNLPLERQKEFTHRYMLGLYALIQRLVDNFPDILFESCSAGGNRFDLGMLYYMPQTWASDNTDAIQRLDIQWGTSMGYPLAATAAHVSICPNHQTGRTTPIQLRGAVAVFGTFGYELDPSKLSPEEKKIVIQQIQAYKKYQALISQGNFYRLSSPESNFCAWSVVSTAQKEALVLAVCILSSANPAALHFRLDGLNPETLYCIDELGVEAYGSELMNLGIWMPIHGDSIKETELICFNAWQRKGTDPFFPDFSGILFHIIEKNKK